MPCRSPSHWSRSGCWRSRRPDSHGWVAPGRTAPFIRHLNCRQRDSRPAGDNRLVLPRAFVPRRRRLIARLSVATTVPLAFIDDAACFHRRCRLLSPTVPLAFTDGAAVLHRRCRFLSPSFPRRRESRLATLCLLPLDPRLREDDMVGLREDDMVAMADESSSSGFGINHPFTI